MQGRVLTTLSIILVALIFAGQPLKTNSMPFSITSTAFGDGEILSSAYRTI